MKKRIAAFCLTVLLGLLPTACGGSGGEGGDRLSVYASIFPVADFTAAVGGGLVDVKTLVTPGGEAHDWEPTPRDVVELGKSAVFFYNGAGMEPWVDSLLAAQKEGFAAVNTSGNCELLTGEEHDHGHEDGDAHEEEEDEDHDHGAVDPHTWLSPANAKLQTAAIAEALCAADPDNAPVYQANLAAYHAELDGLDAAYRDMVAKAGRRTIVVAHRAYGYLCHEYGLEQVAVRGFSPEQEPDPATMAQVVKYCRENDVRVIFVESEADPKTASAIAAETGAEIRVLTPIESLSEADRASGENYLTLMRRNLDVLAQALESN